MPWRTWIPTPPSGASQMPPPPQEFQGGALERLPSRGPGLGAHHLLHDCREGGLGEQNHVQLPLSNRVLEHAQGRDVGLRHVQWPRVGVHVPTAQQREGGGPIAILSRGGEEAEPRSPQRGEEGGGGRGGSTRPTNEFNCWQLEGVRGGVRGGAASLKNT